MGNTKEILTEIRELRSLMARLMGMPEQSGPENFSTEALDKAAKEFQKLSIERGEWVESSQISKYIKSAPYDVGNFIREEFAFTNCFKRGRTYYYFKEDIITLGKQLKERNVDLRRYMELKADQATFKKYIADILQNTDAKGKKKKFRVPEALRDITTSSPKMPAPEVLKAELEKLKEEFFQLKLSEYIDIYKGNYAMSKYLYNIQKYIEPTLRRRIGTWVGDFNLVNQLIEEITKKKENFIPVPEAELIRL